MAGTPTRWVAWGPPALFLFFPRGCSRAIDHQIRQPTKRFFSSTSSSGGGDYLRLTDEELMRQCEMDTFKASGPGGQHRNKRESAVRLKHLATGIVAQAVEERSQHQNRATALVRLRTLLALKGRKWIWTVMRLPWSYYKFFPNHQQLEAHTQDLKLAPKIRNLLWGCKLYWIYYLLFKVLCQMQLKC